MGSRALTCADPLLSPAVTTPQGDPVPPAQPQHQTFQNQQSQPAPGSPATAPTAGPTPGYGQPPASTPQPGFAPQQGFAPPPYGPGPTAPGQPAQPRPAQGQAALLQDSVWHGPASYWVSHPLGYATFGAVLGLVLGVVLAVVAPAGGEMTTAGLVTTVVGMPGLAALAVTVLWIPTMIVSRLLGKAFSGLGDSGGKLLGLLAILLGGGIGFVAFLVAGSTPMWGFILGFFGTMLSMNIGQAIGRGVFFRRPGRVRVGAIVLGVLVVLAAVSWVVSALG
jgi:hypothetical protein